MSHEPSQGWRRDVVAGHQAMDTTGGSTWDAAHRLCDFLEAQWGQLMADEAPRAVELGAGTGWLGMTLARNVATAGCVCLTEQASGGAMEWLEQNLSANVAAGLPLEPVQLQELDWSRWAAGEPVQLPQPPEGSWDLLIGSDLIYSQAGVQLLPRVLRSFAEAFPQLTMLYCHTLHRFDDFDLEFCREIRQQGLQYRVVAAEGAARPAEAGSDLDPLEDDCGGFLEESCSRRSGWWCFKSRFPGTSWTGLPASPGRSLHSRPRRSKRRRQVRHPTMWSRWAVYECCSPRPRLKSPGRRRFS
ncbi:unnamed protein product [Effrenium voratum]|nr:unnamed protein product [Effrenium voratum]